MKRSIPVLMAALIFWCGTVDVARASGTVTRSWMMQFLEEQGFRPKLDEDGDVLFRVEGKAYFCFLEEKDPEYLSLNLFVGYKTDQAVPEDKAVAAAQHITATTKMGKATVLKQEGGIIRVGYSLQTLADTETFPRRFKRFLNILQLMEREMQSILINTANPEEIEEHSTLSLPPQTPRLRTV